MAEGVLPLFPLDVVLFPGATLPLHIYEPRYKEMARWCLEERERFGVVRAGQESVARVGCTAEILRVVKTYDDGRMDIVAAGRERFRLLEVFDDLPYLQGRVEFLPDVAGPVDPAAAERARALFEEAYRVVHGRGAAPPPADEGEGQVSHRLAAALPLDLDFKQLLLEERSESARLEALADGLEDWLARERKVEHVKSIARGNGRGR